MKLETKLRAEYNETVVKSRVEYNETGDKVTCRVQGNLRQCFMQNIMKLGAKFFAEHNETGDKVTFRIQ